LGIQPEANEVIVLKEDVVKAIYHRYIISREASSDWSTAISLKLLMSFAALSVADSIKSENKD